MGGSAAAAAAGEQEDDEDDPDPVVVVEHVAQTVVHSEPPKRYEVGRRGSVSITIVCRRAEKVRENCRAGAEKSFSFSKIPLDKNGEMVYNICVRGYSLMVKLQLPKLATRVRFPLPAPKQKPCISRLFLFLAVGQRKIAVLMNFMSK